jgi:hypothetical protein
LGLVVAVDGCPATFAVIKLSLGSFNLSLGDWEYQSSKRFVNKNLCFQF